MVFKSYQDKKRGSTVTSNDENAKAASVRGTHYSTLDPFGTFGLATPQTPTPEVHRNVDLIFRDVTSLVNHDNQVEKPENYVVGEHFLKQLTSTSASKIVSDFDENRKKPTENNPFSIEADTIQRPTPVITTPSIGQILDGRRRLQQQDSENTGLINDLELQLAITNLRNVETRESDFAPNPVNVGNLEEQLLLQNRVLPLTGERLVRSRAAARRTRPSFFDDSTTIGRPTPAPRTTGLAAAGALVDPFNLQTLSVVPRTRVVDDSSEVLDRRLKAFRRPPVPTPRQN